MLPYCPTLPSFCSITVILCANKWWRTYLASRSKKLQWCTYIRSGQSCGLSITPPPTTYRSTSSLDSPWYGCSANVIISHSTTPYDLKVRQMTSVYCNYHQTTNKNHSTTTASVQHLLSCPPVRQSLIRKFGQTMLRRSRYDCHLETMMSYDVWCQTTS